MDAHSNVQTVDEAPPRTDWLSLLVAGFLFLWIVSISLVTHVGGWVAEQISLALGFDWPSYGWPVISLAQALAILAPAVLLSRWQRLRYRAVFRVWAGSGLFALILVPVRLAPLTAAQLAAALQILFTLTFIMLLLFYQRRRRPNPIAIQRTSGLVAAAALVSAVIGYSWLALGALGSPLDTVLNLVAGLLFGIAAALLLEQQLFQPLRTNSRDGRWNIVLAGVAAGAVLLVMATSFGVNGMQLLLLFPLPALAWLVATLALATPSEGAYSNWRPPAVIIGLAAALPMMLVDPDELILLLNTSRDILFWSGLAAALSLLLAWAAGLLAFVARRRLAAGGWRHLLRAAAVLAWLGGGAIYFSAGQPGFHGERLFVILQAEPNLEGAMSSPDYDGRREYVYRQLVENAESSQMLLRRTFDQYGIDYTPYYLVNALEIEGDPILRIWLRRRPEVARVLDNPVLRPLPAPPAEASGPAAAPDSVPWNLVAVGADRVWDELGVRGTGIVIGQSDSGVQGDHPELAESYRGRSGAELVHDYNWLDPWYQTTEPTDWGGHGTHTLGTVLGATTGVAPGATWIGCVNLARNLGNPARYLDCLQFLLAPFPASGDPFRDGKPELGAHVLNNSWGCPEIEGCDPATFQSGMDALRAAGIFVVVSAGNDGLGGCGTVDSPPAIYEQVLSVGAIDRRDQLADFSSLGPVVVDDSGRLKPDLVAPGVDILSAFPNGTYAVHSGTSMAGPHVAGVVALLWSANPDLIGDIGGTETILRDTARAYNGPLPECIDPGSPNNAVGYGIVDAYAAVQRALGER